MRVLVNISPRDQRYTKALNWLLKSEGFVGVSTTRTLSPVDLQKACKLGDCAAAIVINLETLKNLVGDPRPSLFNWRGSRLNYEYPVFILDHPSSMYTENHGEWLMRRDLAKVKLSWKAPAKFKYTICDSQQRIKQMLAVGSKALLMGIDIETNQWSMKKHGSKASTKVPCHTEDLEVKGLGDTFITMVSYTTVSPEGDYHTWILPLVNGFHDFWATDAEYGFALRAIQKMNDTQAYKILHNGQYDNFHLIRYHAWVRNWIFDTMGLEHSWWSELKKDLGMFSSLFLYDHYYWKWLADKEHKAKDGDFNSYCEYAGRDTWAMTRAFVELAKTAPAWVWTNYARSFPKVYPSLYGAFEGVKVCLDTRKRLKAEAEKRLDQLDSDLAAIADDPEFNAGSAPQKANLIYGIWGATRNERAKSESATDKLSLKKVAMQNPILARIVDLMLKRNNDAKAVSTYYNFLLYGGRLLYSLDPFGTETGRFASRGSPMWVGTQIQNQPYYAKEQYVADEGYVLFELDYSKAEANCTAHLSQCVKLINALNNPELDKEGNPKDFYKVLGELFFGMQYEDVTTYFRNKVLKKIQHGTNYMMGANTFIDNLDDVTVLYEAAAILGYQISEKPTAKKGYITAPQFATKLLDSYHTPFPEVRQWWETLRDEVANTGQLVSPSGHVRQFFGDPRKNHGVWRSAVAHQPQNTSVENLNNGYLKAYKMGVALAKDYPNEPNILRIKTQIHDSLFGQVKEEYAADLLPKLAKLIEARQVIHGREMTISVDIEASTTTWKAKIEWQDFLKTTLPTLVSQKSLTCSTDG